MDIMKEDDGNEVNQLAEAMETVSLNEGAATMDESLKKKKPINPMLLSPVISCVFKFLKLEDIKSCRFVSREWGSIGKTALARRALIYFHKNDDRPGRFPVDFHSCFLNSATLFNAFQIRADFTKDISYNSWIIEELALFFEEHQSYIKELGLKLIFTDANIGKKIDIPSWISKSPIVQKDAKWMTRLSIFSWEIQLDIPFLLVAHIKDLQLYNCRINLEGGKIKICPIELELTNVTFSEDERTLIRVRVNDIVDFSKAKKISLDCKDVPTKYVLDLWGNVTLDKLNLNSVEIMNGGTSQWAVDHLRTFSLPYSLNRQMKIKKLDLYYVSFAVDTDLLNLPTSIQELTIYTVGETTSVFSRQPIVLENLQYLTTTTDYSFLSHFTNCPQLTHLNLSGCPESGNEMSFLLMPKTVKTLTLGISINWVDDNYLDLEELYFDELLSDDVKQLCNAKIRVGELFMLSSYLIVDQDFIDFLEYRNRFSFGNRFYVGKFDWEEEKFEDSLLKDHVDVQAQFYVFENGERGRALPETFFNQLEFYQILRNIG